VLQCVAVCCSVLCAYPRLRARENVMCVHTHSQTQTHAAAPAATLSESVTALEPTTRLCPCISMCVRECACVGMKVLCIDTHTYSLAHK